MTTRKLLRWFALSIAVMLMLSTPVGAFQDLSQDEVAYDKIMMLRDLGVISGVNGDFRGDKELTYAEGIHMLVKGMELNLDGYAFIKRPEASDSYDHIPEDTWYTGSFITAAVLGMGLDREVDPQAVLTREAYAHYLMTALGMTGNYPFTKMLYVIQDQDEIDPSYAHSIQLLLNGKITRLDDEGSFRPKQEITRKEAAIMLADAIEFKNRYKVLQSGVDPESDGTVSFEVTAVSEDVNKVTVSWGEQPNPGYGIRIAGIEFMDEEQKAIVYYSLSYPHPDRMYPQVIVYPKDETYVAAEYTVKIAEKDTGVEQDVEKDTDVERNMEKKND